MKATVKGTLIAQAGDPEVVSIEGNYYFPPSALIGPALKDSPTPYVCPWKGVAQYYDVVTSDGVFRDSAWSYPEPKASAIQRVGVDFSGYVAFDEAQVLIESDK